MPSILYPDDNVTYVARKNFKMNGVEYAKGDDVPEFNDHSKLEVYVRNGYVIPVVEDKEQLPFQFRRTVMTRDVAMLKLKIGNPKGQHEGDRRGSRASEALTGTDPAAPDLTSPHVKEDHLDEEYDPGEHSVDDVYAYAETLDRDGLLDIYALEEEGKNRSTLLKKLDGLLNEKADEENEDEINV